MYFIFVIFFIVTILDVTIFKKSRKKVINPYYSLGFVYHHDLSIAHASLGVSYKWINQRLLSDQCMLVDIVMCIRASSANATFWS